MILYYIQDSVGADTPIAPFAKATPTNILAYTLKIYRNDELRQVNHYDYIAAQGKHLCRTKTCTRSLEYESEYVRNKHGILTKVVTTYTNGEQEVHNFRGTVKREDTFVKGYLASRYHPNAKLTKTFKFSKHREVYCEIVDLKENQVTQFWEKYDWAGRRESMLYIRSSKKNPANIMEFESYTYFYMHNNMKDSRLSSVVGLIRLGDSVRSTRDVFSNYDDYGNWRTRHRYELNQDLVEELKYIEKREIAYTKDELEKVNDAYEEAAFELNLDEYIDNPDSWLDGVPF